MLFTAAKNLSGLAVLLGALVTGQVCSAAPNGVLAPVATMYRTFAWEALSNDVDLFGNGLTSQPASTLSKYFEPGLAKMIADDAACQRRKQAFCKLDFDILFDSQDPRIVDLSIAERSPSTVEVRFKDPLTAKETLITYTVGRLGSGWRITDVVYVKEGQYSLRALLLAPPKRVMSAASKK